MLQCMGSERCYSVWEERDSSVWEVRGVTVCGK